MISLKARSLCFLSVNQSALLTPLSASTARPYQYWPLSTLSSLHELACCVTFTPTTVAKRCMVKPLLPDDGIRRSKPTAEFVLGDLVWGGKRAPLLGFQSHSENAIPPPEGCGKCDSAEASKKFFIYVVGAGLVSSSYR